MAYEKTIWVDGENKYDIKTQANTVINTDIKLVYKGTTGTPISSTKLNQIDAAIEKLYNGDGLYNITTNIGNTYSVAFETPYTSYTQGLNTPLKFNAANTGSATINYDGLGAKTLKKFEVSGKVNLAAGDIIANGLYITIYDGTDVILINPTAILASILAARGDMIVASGANTPSNLALGPGKKALISNGVDIVYGYPAEAYYSISDTVLLTMNTERGHNGTYGTVKIFKMGYKGSVRVKGQFKSTTGTAYVRVYNGTTSTIIGSEQATTSLSYVNFTIDTSNCNAGDSIYIQISGAASGSPTVYVQNVTVCADETAYTTSVISD